MLFQSACAVFLSTVLTSICLSVVSATPIAPEEPQVLIQGMMSAEQECTYACSYLPRYVPQPSLFLNGHISCVYYDPIAEKTCIYSTSDGTSNDPSCQGKLELICTPTKQTLNSATQTEIRRRLEGRQWSAAKERAEAKARQAARRRRSLP
ncbi:hypothetical protein [Phaffia rhodozyma]|uniref:Uncharacterized protein n=1 Tax=Phaffia rhodozyma TaxID=264483 RepID=A0A0F7SL32_PHARH|nr:hypothetical protein [Phaffia rhodozyma]